MKKWKFEKSKKNLFDTEDSNIATVQLYIFVTNVTHSKHTELNVDFWFWCIPNIFGSDSI